MSFFVFGVLFFAVDAVAILLLAATWQRTRILGFAIVAASYLTGVFTRWLAPWIYQLLDGGDATNLAVPGLVVQLLYLVISLVALAGFWDIYRALKARPAA
ncbi:hypothetical protein [Arenimonas alkanexedens]